MATHILENAEAALNAIGKIQVSLANAINFQLKNSDVSSGIIANSKDNEQLKILEKHSVLFAKLRQNLVEQQQQLLPQYRITKPEIVADESTKIPSSALSTPTVSLNI